MLCHIGGALQLDGSFSVEAWTQAVADVVRVADAMRWVPDDAGSAPVQRLLDPEEVRVQVPRDDFSAQLDGQARALRYLGERFVQAFDLRRCPPWEICWVDAGGERAYVLLRFHHLIADGAALSLIGQRLVEATTVRLKVEPNPLVSDALRVDSGEIGLQCA